MEAPALDRTPLKSCAGKGRERKAIRKVGDSDNGGDGIESTCSLPGLLNPGGSVEEGRVARGVGLPCPGIGPPLPPPRASLLSLTRLGGRIADSSSSQQSQPKLTTVSANVNAHVQQTPCWSRFGWVAVARMLTRSPL